MGYTYSVLMAKLCDVLVNDEVKHKDFVSEVRSLSGKSRVLLECKLLEYAEKLDLERSKHSTSFSTLQCVQKENNIASVKIFSYQTMDNNAQKEKR